MDKEIKISTASLGLTYAGCFFGAGYVSGKELYEFFGSFGIKGYLGIILSILLFFIFGVLLIRNVQLSGKTAFDEVILIKNYKIPRALLGGMTVFMVFGIFVVMIAGTGALLNQVFNLPQYLGCLLFTVIACIAALFGIGGTVKVFSTLIPILVVVTLVICVIALNKYGLTFDLPVTNNNKLLINWLFSSFTYVSYNMVTLIGTMIPVGSHIKKRSTVFSGIAFGCIAALSIAVGILMSVTSIYGASAKELPMLDIAFRIGNLFGIIYSVLLLFAMFGTSLSSLVAINVYVKEKFPGLKKYITVIMLFVGAIAFICSLRGFGNLVNTVYPIFGYVGFVILLIIIINNIKLRRKN